MQERGRAGAVFGWAVLDLLSGKRSIGKMTNEMSRLWLDGNGRVTCDKVRCAGSTASGSGMKYDLNGAEMVEILPEMIAELGFEPRCESCGVGLTRTVQFV